MKRAALLLALLLLSCCVFPAPAANAEEAAPPRVYTNGDFTYTLDENGGAVITGYTGAGGKLIVPAKLSKHPVVGIGVNAFMGNKNLTMLTLPEGVLSIGNASFAGCSLLAAVILPDSLVSIGSNPFERTPADIIISPNHPVFALIDGVLYEKATKKLIAYPYGSERTGYVIPDGIQIIGDFAFSFCRNLKHISLPDSLESTGIGALSGIMVDFTMAADHPHFLMSYGALLEKADMRLVYYPYRSKNISYAVPDGTRIIGQWTFAYNDSLTSLILPEGLIGIEDVAFRKCTALESLTLPQSLTSIGAQAFFGCKALASLAFPDGMTDTGWGSFEECESLTTVVLPENLEFISGRTFARCNSLESIQLPEGMKAIASSAFEECAGLTSLTLPKSLQYIGKNAFKGCDKLVLSIYPDTWAASWAKTSGIPFQYIGTGSLDWLNN